MNEAEPLIRDGVAFAVATVLIAALLTVPVSLALLALYRRAVLRSMRRGAPAGSGESSDPGTAREHSVAFAAVAPAAAHPLRLEVLEGSSPVALSPAAAELLERASRIPRRAAAVYVAAGLAQAAVLTVLLFSIGGLEFFPLRTLVVGLVLAWPVAVTVTYVAVANRRLKLLLPVLYTALVLVVSGSYWQQILWLLAWMAGPPALLLAAFANRTLRSVGPFVLVVLCLVVAGALIGLPVMYNLLLHTTAGVSQVRMAGLAVPLLCGLAGWLFVRWSARYYREKKLSDQMLQLNTWWLLFTLWGCSFLAYNIHQNPTLAGAGLSPLVLDALGLVGLLAFAAYWATSRLGLRPLASAARQHLNTRLLLLRVFGSRRRSERLLDELGMRWRYLGSIQMIAGTDLATATLEPHEFFDFLSGRLSRQFVKDEADLDTRIAGMDLQPDPDGRFRVNEFFCHDHTWRSTLDRLATENQAVLMDLRGFRAENEGCIYEITQLMNRVPLPRVVFAVDDDTDHPALESVLQRAWRGMAMDSPNRGRADDALRVLHIHRQDSREIGQLLRLLCAAASPEPTPAPSAAGHPRVAA